MPSAFPVKLRYLYISAIVLWSIVIAGFSFQFHQDLYSSQTPKVVNELCRSILDNMFLTDGIFAFLTFLLAGAIFWQKRTVIYFYFSYIVYTGSTIISMFTLNDELINYQQHHGIWQGGVPMGQFLYVLLLMLVGIVAIFGYLLTKISGWLRDRLRRRND
jgi:hypothetical protein